MRGTRCFQRLGVLGAAVALALASLASASGCIDDWKDPPLPSHATSSSATSGPGGAGGAGGAGGGAGGEINPTCADHHKNGLETAVDCGGDSCSPCTPGLTCQNDADCTTGNCTEKLVCGPKLPFVCPPGVDPAGPSCADCVKNGLESDVDCGGDSCGPCPFGGACAVDADCVTGACTAGTCSAAAPGCDPVDPDNATCNDCVKNGGETDVDCGGDACGPCPTGMGCSNDADCEELDCKAGLCAVAVPACDPVDPDNPTCNDCTTNGFETDVDCGGDSCLPCKAGKACEVSNDCASIECAEGSCQ